MRVIVRRELTPLADRIETDGFGSLIAVLGRNADAPRVMIAAHMDELGMIVKHVTGKRLREVSDAGRMADQGLINQRSCDSHAQGRGPRRHRSENSARDGG